MSLIDDVEEGHHDFHGDLREENDRLLGGHSLGSAHQQRAQRQQEGFVDLRGAKTFLLVTGKEQLDNSP